MAEEKQYAAWAARIAAIGIRGEQIKQASAEHLWICRGIKPAPLPDLPTATNTNVASNQPQLRKHPLHRAPVTKQQRP